MSDGYKLCVAVDNPIKVQRVTGPGFMRKVEQGLRLANFWAPAFYGFLEAPEFTNDDIMLYCYLGLIQSRHVQKFTNTSVPSRVYEMPYMSRKVTNKSAGRLNTEDIAR